MGQTKDKRRKGHGCQEILRKHHAQDMPSRDGHIQTLPRRHGAQNMS